MLHNINTNRFMKYITGDKDGHYAVYTFYGKPEDISETERNYRIDDNVMKFITVKMDMEAIK